MTQSPSKEREYHGDLDLQADFMTAVTGETYTQAGCLLYTSAFRVVCTPELLPQLALGRLLTEGWITSAQEVEQTTVCAEGLKVNV